MRWLHYKIREIKTKTFSKDFPPLSCFSKNLFEVGRFCKNMSFSERNSLTKENNNNTNHGHKYSKMKSDLVFEPQKLKMKKSVQFKEDFELCEVFLYSFPCDICEFRTANKRKLEKHLLRHYKGTKHPSQTDLHRILRSLPGNNIFCPLRLQRLFWNQGAGRTQAKLNFCFQSNSRLVYFKNRLVSVEA